MPTQQPSVAKAMQTWEKKRKAASFGLLVATADSSNEGQTRSWRLQGGWVLVWVGACVCVRACMCACVSVCVVELN
jgi:hypothetical protein